MDQLSRNLVIGGLYSVESGDGRFGVVKVLALEPGIVHARLYREKFESRPTRIDPAELSLGSVFQSADIGIGHVPLEFETFMKWHPVLIMQTPVTEEELIGYNFWVDAHSTAENTFDGPLRSIVRNIAGIVRRKHHN